MRMRAPAILRMFQSALRAWWDDDALRLGASLAYYTLFAIAPILLVATAIAGMVFGAEAVRGEIVGQLDHLIGREGARAVQSLLEGASQRRTGILATVFGSITFVVAATGAFLELQGALNTIWRVKPNPGTHLKAFLIDRLRSFGLVVAIGFLLMVSLAVTAALAALNGWLARYAPDVPLLWSGVSMFVSLMVTTGLFALLFRFLPDVHLRWRDVMTGALATAVLFHDRSAAHRLVSRTEQHGLQLRRSGIGDDPPALGVLLVPDPAARCRVHPRVRSARRHEAGPGVLRGKRPWRSVRRHEGTFLPHHVVINPAAARSSRAANTARCAGHITLYSCEDLELCVWTQRGFSGADPSGQVLRRRWIAQRC